MKNILLRIFAVILTLYVAFCAFFYFYQEKLIFYPQKLEKNHAFHFKGNFEEINIETKDNLLLNGLLFRSEDTKGLIFYLHGNAGSLKTWGQLASSYTDNNYDIFFLDYRGFGKSEGHISSQNELFEEIQVAYNVMKKRYNEQDIIIVGYSIGTGPAAWLSSQNNPEKLILLAPYYSLTNVVQSICPVIPRFIVKYKLETYKYIKDCGMPVTIFHGDKDEVIDYGNSIDLRELFKTTDSLITLKGVGHNDLLTNEILKETLNQLLIK